MTKIDMLNTQKGREIYRAMCVGARDLGYGELPQLSEVDRTHIEGEAKHYVELWEEAVEIKTSPTIRPITPLRRLLAEYHETAKESSMSKKSRSVSGLTQNEPRDLGGGRRPSIAFERYEGASASVGFGALWLPCYSRRRAMALSYRGSSLYGLDRSPDFSPYLRTPLPGASFCLGFHSFFRLSISSNEPLQRGITLHQIGFSVPSQSFTARVHRGFSLRGCSLPLRFNNQLSVFGLFETNFKRSRKIWAIEEVLPMNPATEGKHRHR